METRFSMERLIKPTIKSLLKIHNIYVIQNKTIFDRPTYKPSRVRCDSITANIYLLEIVDEKILQQVNGLN